MPAPGRDLLLLPLPSRQDSEPPSGRARGGVRARGPAGHGHLRTAGSDRDGSSSGGSSGGGDGLPAPPSRPSRPATRAGLSPPAAARAPMRPEPLPAARWRP